MKKIISLCLAAVMLLSLMPAGFAAKTKAGDAGGTVYEAMYVDVYGKSYAYSGFSGGKLFIELCEDGTGYAENQDGGNAIVWSRNGNTVEISEFSDEFDCSLNGSVLSLRSRDSGAPLTVQLVSRDAEPIVKKYMENRKKLNGDWYGWWMITESSGSMSESEGAWWDMCASIYFDTEGCGKITLWDERGSKQQPLGEVELSLFDDGYEYLIPVSESGNFCGSSLKYGDWLLDISGEKLKDTLFLQKGTAVSPSDGSETSYFFMLRPWFTSWSDAEEVLGGDYLPYNYDRYLEMINAGLWMPDIIGAPGLSDAQKLEQSK